MAGEVRGVVGVFVDLLRDVARHAVSRYFLSRRAKEIMLLMDPLTY
jgi:hypothetical protein